MLVRDDRRALLDDVLRNARLTARNAGHDLHEPRPVDRDPWRLRAYCRACGGRLDLYVDRDGEVDLTGSALTGRCAP